MESPENNFTEFIDYYALLNIDSAATLKEIKAAYRRAIRRCHPDLNPDVPDASERTKVVNHAYEVLSDERLRSEYDRQLQAYLEWLSTSKPTEYEVSVTVNLNQAYYGVDQIITLDDQELSVWIPAGVDTGNCLQFPVTHGTLYVWIDVTPDARIRRDGLDLYLDHPIDLFTAILGGEIVVPIFDEELVIKVPPGTSGDRPLRIRQRGMPSLSETSKRGSIYVRPLIRVPRNLTADQRSKFHELAETFRRKVTP